VQVFGQEMRSGKAELRLGLTPRRVMEAAAADPTALRRLTATGNIELGSPLGNASVWHGGNARCSDDLVLVVSKVFRGEAEVCPRLARCRRGLLVWSLSSDASFSLNAVCPISTG
jgi:hypothetical protein